MNYELSLLFKSTYDWLQDDIVNQAIYSVLKYMLH